MRLLAAILLVTLVAPALAQQRHIAPAENLAVIDASVIQNAATTIDMTAYVLTDTDVVDALEAAARRGVVVRLYLDAGESRRGAKFFDALEAAGVEIRFKPGGPLIHLKSYVVDGKILRTGSANFTLGGERRQDNDLIFLTGAADVAAAEAAFERLFAAGEGRTAR